MKLCLLFTILLLVMISPVIIEPFESPIPATGWIWPTTGRITQKYSDYHHGLDIGARYGSDIIASRAGTVIWADWGWAGYGNLVVVDHGERLKTYYAHLREFNVVVGDEIVRGQKLGECGNTGHSTGPHLHFEIQQNWVRFDPLDYLP